MISAVWLALWLLCAVEVATLLACLFGPRDQHPLPVARRLARHALARTRDREDRPTW